MKCPSTHNNLVLMLRLTESAKRQHCMTEIYVYVYRINAHVSPKEDIN